ncbi:hypothetical protein ACFL27_06605 [candidate division CSSED10-310 bacterium]|uniref:HMA domain-containing protein n=1 Tax=candidate division CSSED10-310 bacterium TaxID=2855610 RepID=A0ABV6YUK2_UNCC1
MKKLLILTIAVLVAHFFVAGAVACEKGKHQKHDDCCKFMKDANVEVTNVDNGIVIKITSDKPDMVKMIQEHGAKCKKGFGHQHAHQAGHKCKHHQANPPCIKTKEPEVKETKEPEVKETKKAAEKETSNK